MNRKIVLCALSAAALASCGKSTTPQASSGSAGAAYVRVVNGSADIETANPAIPGATCDFGSNSPSVGTLISAQVDGLPAANAFPYHAVSQYVAVSPGPASITVQYPGGSLTTGCPALSFSTPALSAGSYETVIVAGEYQNKTLQFAVFSDPAPSASPGATVYDAAPASPSVSYGTFVPGTASFSNLGALTFGKTGGAPMVKNAPGTAFFIGSAASPSGTLYPSQVNPFDQNNVLPFQNDNHFSVFVVDPAPGGAAPTLAGAFY